MSRALRDPLPLPACKYGYTIPQIKTMITDVLHFNGWMRGQTGAICDGREYNHEAGVYQDTGCGPHGRVVYPWDVKRYVDGGPIVD